MLRAPSLLRRSGYEGRTGLRPCEPSGQFHLVWEMLEGGVPLRGVTGPAVWAVLGAEPLGKPGGKPGDHLAGRPFEQPPLTDT